MSNEATTRLVPQAISAKGLFQAHVREMLYGILFLGLTAAACPAAFVVWEDQFTGPDAGWSVPGDSTFTYQASSAANSEDGFELVFTSTSPSVQYATYSLPFTALLPGDKLEWGVRTYWPYSSGATADRVTLENAVYDSGFTIHDSGDLFTKLSKSVNGTLQATTNLYLGNSSAATAVDGQVPSVMYVDYVRITREVPEPGTIALSCLALGLFGFVSIRGRSQR